MIYIGLNLRCVNCAGYANERKHFHVEKDYHVAARYTFMSNWSTGFRVQIVIDGEFHDTETKRTWSVKGNGQSQQNYKNESDDEFKSRWNTNHHEYKRKEETEMINRVNMDGVKPYGDVQILPKGGYVMKILGVEVKTNKVGQYLQLSCDVCEGEYKNFFADDYRSQSDPKKWHCNAFVNVPRDDGSERDGWTKRSFATFTDALEQSNSGYHFDWDETKLKGLIVGGLFVIREYEGNDGTVRESTTLASWTSAEKVRTGKYRLPKDKLLKRDAAAPASNGMTPVSVDDDLPF